jgi:hypothetical protein
MPILRFHNLRLSLGDFSPIARHPNLAATAATQIGFARFTVKGEQDEQTAERFKE